MQSRPARANADAVLLAAFPLVLLAERFSHFGTRAILRTYLLSDVGSGGLGLPRAAARQLYELFSTGVALAPVLALAATVVLGPRVAAAAGLLLVAGGQLLLATARADLLYPFLILHVTGVGMFLPSWWVLAACLQRHEQATHRAMTFTGLYLMTLLAAILGPAFAVWITRASGPPLAFAGTAALGLVAGAAALVAVAVPGPWERGRHEGLPGFAAAPWIGVLVAAAVVYWTLVLGLSDLVSGPGLDRLDLDAAARSQVVVFRASAVWITAIAWIALAGLRRAGLRIRTGRLVAVGLATTGLAAAGAAVTLATGLRGAAALAGIGLALVLGGIAEALFAPLGLAAVASAARPRTALVYVAAWLVAAEAASAIVRPGLGEAGLGRDATSFAILAGAAIAAAVTLDRVAPVRR